MRKNSSYFLIGVIALISCITKLSSENKILDGILTQNTYLGPISPLPGDPHLVKIQLSVKDSPELGGVQIQSVEFNGQKIPLKPRDIDGNRGGASFQLPPGKTKLKWTVERSKITWPRTVSHEEEVNINSSDFWIQISIVGETASIN